MVSGLRVKGRRGEGLSFWSVFAIGVGGMVGGGIFAVLGLAVQLAHGSTPIAFAIAGFVALITSYSYAKLSTKYPSQGGTVEYLIRGFGGGILTGGLNILLWLSYVIMLSLYSYAFGSYGASFLPPASRGLWKHVFISAIVIALTLLNFRSVSAVGEVEELVVGLKIGILLLFVIAGSFFIHPAWLQPSNWATPLGLVTGGMIIFLAYEGFELIANTAKDVKEPGKLLPKAFYSSVIFVIALYVTVALVTVGNLPYSKIVNARDYALAAAARPFLGEAGFTLIALAALLSTTSAINATLYGTARVSYIIAKYGELPKTLERKVWNKPLEGLIITSAITLLVANLFNLSSISMMGSAGFLIIFAAVNMANAKLSVETGSSKPLAIAGAVACSAALAALILKVVMWQPSQVLVLAALIGISFATEVIYRRWSGRRIKHPSEYRHHTIEALHEEFMKFIKAARELERKKR